MHRNLPPRAHQHFGSEKKSFTKKATSPKICHSALPKSTNNIVHVSKNSSLGAEQKQTRRHAHKHRHSCMCLHTSTRPQIQTYMLIYFNVDSFVRHTESVLFVTLPLLVGGRTVKRYVRNHCRPRPPSPSPPPKVKKNVLLASTARLLRPT